jgi:hypothetical protein
LTVSFAKAAAKHGDSHQLSQNWELLRRRAPSQRRRPCPREPPVGDLFELAREAGGFSVMEGITVTKTAMAAGTSGGARSHSVWTLLPTYQSELRYRGMLMASPA